MRFPQLVQVGCHMSGCLCRFVPWSVWDIAAPSLGTCWAKWFYFLDAGSQCKNTSFPRRFIKFNPAVSEILSMKLWAPWWFWSFVFYFMDSSLSWLFVFWLVLDIDFLFPSCFLVSFCPCCFSILLWACSSPPPALHYIVSAGLVLPVVVVLFQPILLALQLCVPPFLQVCLISSVCT